jgi:hypothetical protein
MILSDFIPLVNELETDLDSEPEAATPDVLEETVQGGLLTLGRQVVQGLSDVKGTCGQWS